jgi:hypothetical protein
MIKFKIHSWSAKLTVLKIASQAEKFLTSVLEVQGPNDKLLQQNGAPPHFQEEAPDFLNRNFPEKWFGVGDANTRPLRSTDLNPLSFIVFGVHQGCCVPLAGISPELAGRVRDAAARVTLHLLNNIWSKIGYTNLPCYSRCPHSVSVKQRSHLDHTICSNASVFIPVPSSWSKFYSKMVYVPCSNAFGLTVHKPPHSNWRQCLSFSVVILTSLLLMNDTNFDKISSNSDCSVARLRWPIGSLSSMLHSTAAENVRPQYFFASLCFH